MHLRILAAFACFAVLGGAQNFRVSTIAGFGTFGGDGGTATAALVNPTAVAVAPDGTIYVSDPTNYRIRKIDHLGVITTLTGSGSGAFSGDGGPAVAAQIAASHSIALDSLGNLYFSDEDNLRIREVTAAGVIKTIAGNGICGSTTAGMAATSAPLCDVDSVAMDSQNRVYFGAGSRIWMIGSDGLLTLVAGTGDTTNEGDGGLATAAKIGYPGSLAIDHDGSLYLADLYNFVVRKVTTDKRISTVTKITDVNATTIMLAVDASGTLFYVTGTKQVLKIVQGAPANVTSVATPNTADCLAVDQAGAIFLCSTATQRLLRIANGSIDTIAGAYPYGVDSLPATAANVRLHLEATAIGLAVDAANNVYFPELDNNLLQRIDKVTPGGILSAVSTPASLPTKVDFTAQALTFSPSGSLYFTTFSQVYRAETNGTVTLIAGAPGFPSALGDGGPATAAKLTNPSSLVFDPSGNLYIAEPFASRVRKVNTQNIITTFAGNGSAGYTGDGGPASSAKLAAPVDVKLDSHGNMYIADVSAAVVRKVDTGGIITTVAGKGTFGFSGDGGPAIKAELSGAAAIALDPSGNLFIADRSQAAATFIATHDNNRIRMVNPSGVITTIFGPTPGYSGEGVQAQTAALGGPVALVSDAQGNIYVSESATQRIRKMTPIAASSVAITSVNTAYGNPEISQNAWMEIKGTNLAPASVGTGVVWSNAPEFQQGKMPTQLNDVSVTVNGKPAFIYFVSVGQINALSPLDGVTGDVAVVVTNGGVASAPFTVKMRAASPSFLRVLASNYITATHADFSLLGAPSLSASGYTFTPAKPNEVVVMYAVGFGLPSSTLVNGSASQFGSLTPLPAVQIGGTTASVQFAGINGAPGLYQLNVVVPAGTANGDIPVTVSYGGMVTPAATLSVQR
ncbi:MAG: hypothetical protein ABI693_05595 [Bryobacteraceae bacterium]